MISKEASAGITAMGGVGGSATAFLDFMGFLSANTAALGLIVSALGIAGGIIFYTLNYMETKRHNRVIENKIPAKSEWRISPDQSHKSL